MSGTIRQPPPSQRGEPLWAIAEFFPEQGDWTEDQYLKLNTNRLVEFNQGMIEVLPVPTKTHQLILAFLYKLIEAFVGSRGRVIFAGYRLRVSAGKYREPDILFLTHSQFSLAGEDYTATAELVVEVVSPDDPNRDYVTKRTEYAAAGIAEYWIVDRIQEQILVLKLAGAEYVEHGIFRPGERATSHLLTGFDVSVDEVFSQGK